MNARIFVNQHDVGALRRADDPAAVDRAVLVDHVVQRIDHIAQPCALARGRDVARKQFVLSLLAAEPPRQVGRAALIHRQRNAAQERQHQRRNQRRAQRARPCGRSRVQICQRMPHARLQPDGVRIVCALPLRSFHSISSFKISRRRPRAMCSREVTVPLGICSSRDSSETSYPSI